MVGCGGIQADVCVCVCVCVRWSGVDSILLWDVEWSRVIEEDVVIVWQDAVLLWNRVGSSATG